jgi:hypothetical protein
MSDSVGNRLIEVDGFDLRSDVYNVATRTGRYSMPAIRGENLILPGANGSVFLANKPYDVGIGALAVWTIGATVEDVEVARNYFTNPSTEVDASGWTALNSFTVVQDGTLPQFGSKSLLVTTPVGGSAQPAASFAISGLTVGKAYTFSAYVYLLPNAAGTTGSYSLRVGSSTSEVTEVAFSSAQFPLSSLDRGAYNRVWVSFIAAATSVTCYLYGASASNESCRFDGFLINDGLRPLPYFDGDSTDHDQHVYAWTGTPGVSASTHTLLNQLTVPDTRNDQIQALEDNMAKLQRIFTRRHRLSLLRAAQPDGSIRRALVEWKEWDEPDVQAGGTRAEWAISYEIPGVWWEDESPTVQSAVAGSLLPKNLDMTSFAGMTGVIEDAVLTVQGPITQPMITDAETGAWVRYNGIVSSSTTWVVDVGNFTSTVNGTSVMLNTTHGGGYKLLTIPNCFGSNDYPRLVLSGSGSGSTTQLTVSAKRKWVSG